MKPSMRRVSRQQTPEFKAAYAARSGIEGTHSQGLGGVVFVRRVISDWQKRIYSTFCPPVR